VFLRHIVVSYFVFDDFHLPSYRLRVCTECDNWSCDEGRHLYCLSLSCFTVYSSFECIKRQQLLRLGRQVLQLSVH